MAEHLYKLGQFVSLNRPLPDHTSSRSFEIIRLLPASVDGEMHYRVRGADKIERAVGERQLSGKTATS